jgi:threonine/homoserine/homoserine lactone efflux protein
MSNAFQTFIAAFVVSALGSIPPGVISLLTIRTAIEEGKSMAFKFVLIAAIMEVPHILFALLFSSYIINNQWLSSWFEYATIAFILILGIVSIFRKQDHTITKAYKSTSIREALFINLLNPFSIPFWLFFTAYLITGNWISKEFSITFFCVGASLGALFTLGGYALLGDFIEKFQIFKRINIDRIFGIVFILLAAYKCIALFVK